MKPFIIGVGGRSCSGKSEVTRYLEKIYKNHIVRIPSDRFFKVFNPKELDKTDGWESPASIRWDRLIYSINKLKKRESTHIPSKGWTEIFDLLIEPKEIILVEGYLIYTNKELVNLMDKKIWVDVSDLNILNRRTIRDGNINGMNYTMTKVIPISKKYEKQQKEEADIIMNGNNTKEEIIKEIEKVIKKWRTI